MKSKYRLVSVLAASLILCSCASSGTSEKTNDSAQDESSVSSLNEEKNDNKEADNEKDTSEETDISANGMSVLSVVTSDGSNKFAKEPVNGYVSSQIASWTPDYEIPAEPYSVECSVSLSDEDNKKLIDSADAKIKVRGNWTTNYDKKPFRLEFAEKQSMPGLNDGNSFKNWLLLAEYKDASMLRNKTALEISDEILGADGLYASDADFVELYINNEYWGVYLIAEPQQANKNRVDITKPEKDYKGTDIGYFLEFDGYFFLEDPLNQFHIDYHDNAGLKPFSNNNSGSGKLLSCLPSGSNDPVKDVGFTIKSEINSQEQHDFIEGFVDGVYRIMYEAAYNQKAFVFDSEYKSISETTDISPEEAVKQVVDVQSLADMYIISELTCDADLYWSSFFMSADFGPDGNRKLTFQAPWDFDSAMGNKSRCPEGTGFYASSIIEEVNGWEYVTVNPWLAVLSYEEWYQDIIREKWTGLYDKGVFDDALKMIESDTAKYSEAFKRNNDKWGVSTKDDSVADELSDKALKCTTQDAAAGMLKDWLDSRIRFMNGYWHK